MVWFSLRLAFVVSIVLGTGFESLAATPKEQVMAVETYLPVQLDVRAKWIKCGTFNGWYYPGLKRIVLCQENLQNVGLARFVYLHELGHAYTFQHPVDFARWGGNYEASADEWAAVWTIVQGNATDLLATADAFEAWGKIYSQHEDDPHPPMSLRAQRLRNMYAGYKNPQGPHGSYWRDCLKYWKSELLRHGIN